MIKNILNEETSLVFKDVDGLVVQFKGIQDNLDKVKNKNNQERNIYVIAGVIGLLGTAIILYKTRKK